MAVDQATDLEELARTVDERLNDQDVDGLLELWADDVTMIWPVGVYEGKAEARQGLEELLRAFPDFRREVEQRFVGEGHIASEYTVTGTFSGGTFAGYEPTGKGGLLHAAEVVTVSDGRIERVRTYYDQMEFAREVGLLPEEGSPGERAMATMTNTVTKLRQRLGR